MKNTVAIIICLLFFFSNSYGQELIIKGRIKCLNKNANSTKGAENIVVVPSFMPSHSTITLSQPSGYFEFNTGIPISKLQDKIITVFVISRCSKCKEVAKRVFISEDQDRQNKNDKKQYVTIQDWMLKTNCKEAELVPFAADSVLRIVIKQPDQDLNKVSYFTALTGAPAALNGLTNLIAVVGSTGTPTGAYYTTKLDSGRIKYGQFLFASPLVQSANTGFNFSPARDMSEAAFWNPSAVSFSRKKYNFSLLTNVRNNIKLGGFAKITKKISITAGFIGTRQDEFRIGNFMLPLGGSMQKDTPAMKLEEYAAFISPVYRFNNKLSASVTFKSVWQKFNYPIQALIADFAPSIITYDTTRSRHFGIDFSATYKISKDLQAGVNLMNITGQKLNADAFKKGCACEAKYQTQRSLGFGLTYKWKRFNVGSDLLFTEDGLYDASFGLNYVPFNNALVSAGYAIKQKSYSFAFRIKHFRLAYINDNGWLINDEKKGKSPILNGRLYGGFIFDFDGFRKEQ